MTFPKGTVLQLYITWIKPESKWLKIWAQVDDVLADNVAAVLSNLEPVLEAGQGLPHPGEVRVGEYCCAKFQEDGVWYRAVITDLSSVLSGRVGVRFSDYGNTDCVPLSDVRLVDPSTFAEPPLAHEFVIAGGIAPGNSWSPEALDFCDKKLRGEQWSCEVTGQMDGLPLVQLFQSEAETFADMLITKHFAQAPTAIVSSTYASLDLKVGKQYSVYVSYITSPAKFWIQKSDSEAQLNELMQEIEAYATSSKERFSAIDVGIPCITTFSEDSLPYRGKVFSITNETAKVQFVDYGNSEGKHWRELQPIPSQFLSLPAQAIECSLNGFNSDSRVDASTISKFKSLTDDQLLECTIVKRNPNNTYVVEITLDRKAISMQLKNNRLSDNKQLVYDKEVIVLRKAYEIVVTNVVSVSKFYCCLASNLDHIQRINKMLQIEMKEESCLDPQECIQGQPCCVYCREDRCWYRAEIEALLSPREFKVFYVDVGKVEIVPPNQIKKLHAQYVKALPTQAIECCTKGFENNKENTSCTEFFRQLTLNKILVIQISNFNSNCAVVDLHNMTTSPHQHINVLLKDQHSTNTGSSLPDSSKIPEPHVNTSHEERLFVTNVDASGKFFGQLIKFSVEDFGQFQEELGTYYSSLPEGSNSLYADGASHLGQYCCTMYSQDEKFYRGHVVSEKGNTVNVFFIDYGNSETKNKNDIFSLAPQFAEIPQQGIMCILDKYSVPQLVDNLHGIIGEVIIEVKVLQKINGVYNVVLTNNKFNDEIKKKLASLTVIERRHYSLPVFETVEEVHVSHITNPNEIWCRLQRYEDKLLKLLDDIEEYCIALGPTDCKVIQPYVGLPCLAKYSVDEGWYRAEITSIRNDTTVHVQFVDFGNSEDTNVSNLKALPPTFQNFTRNCFQCYLLDFPQKNVWSPNEIEIVKNILSEQNVTAYFQYNKGQSEPFGVNLITAMGENLAQKILDTLKLTTSSGSHKTFQEATKGSTLPESSDMDSGWDDSLSAPVVNYSNKGNQNAEPYEFGGGGDSRFNRQNSGKSGRFSKDDRFGGGKENRGRYRSQGDTGSGDELNHSAFGDRRGRNSFKKSRRDTDGFMPRQDQKEQFGFKKWNPSSSKADEDWSDGTLSNDSFQGTGNHKGTAKFGFNSNNNKKFNENLPPRFQKAKGIWEEPQPLFGTEISPIAQTDSQESLSVHKDGDYFVIELAPDSYKDLSVVHVTSPSEFYCQLVENSKKLQQLTNSLNDAYKLLLEDSLQLGNPQIGRACCAQFSEDCTWYRAKILTCYSSSVEVVFVDYGNTETVPINKVKQLNSEFLDLPAQAVKCALDNAKPISQSWTLEDISIFTDMALEKTFIGQFLRRKADGTYCVNLIKADLLQDLLINRELIRKGHGRFIEVPGTTYTRDSLVEAFTEPVIDNGTVEAVIGSWFISPEEFYCQLESSQAALKEMMNQIQKFYSGPEGNNLMLAKFTMNTICIAKFPEDGFWYRAVIVQTSGNKVGVLYVDYGNKQLLEKNELRSIVPQFTILPMQAIKCRLRNVKSLQASWAEVPSEELEKYFGQKSTCTFYINDSSSFSVDMIVDGQSVSQELISAGFATEDKHDASGNSLESEKSSSSSTGAIRIAPNSTVPKFAPFEVLWNKDEFQDVVVTQVTAPDDFWCQLLKDSLKQEDLSTKLDTFYSSLSDSQMKLANPQEGTPCVVRLLEENRWFRAVVKKRPTPSKLLLMLVDVGIDKTVSINQCKVVSPDFLKIAVQAFNCKLSNLPDHYSQEEMQKFSELTCQKELVAQLECRKKNLFIVKLFDDEEKNIQEKVFPKTLISSPSQSPVKKAEQFLSSSTAQFMEPVILVGEQKAFVSHVNKPSRFYVQLADTEADLSEFCEQLVNIYSEVGDNELIPASMSPGMACCAIYDEDQTWYRAEILEVSDNDITVRFVDYGNEQTVNKANVKILKEDFIAIPPLSIECKLADGDNTREWNPTEIANFENLVINQELLVEFLQGTQPCPVNIKLEGDPSKYLKLLGDTWDFVASNSAEPLTEEQPTAIATSFGYETELKVMIIEVESPSSFVAQVMNEEITSVESISSVPPVFEATLYDCYPFNEVWNNISTEYFSELISGKIINLQIIGKESDSKYSVKLEVNEENINEKMVMEGFANSLMSIKDELSSDAHQSAFTIPSLKPGHRSEVSVCHVVSPGQFWIQLSETTSQLNELMASIKSHCEHSSSEEVSFTAGKPCLARYAVDDCWYRGKVLAVEQDAVHVQFVDYGNSDTVNVKATRPVDEEFLKMPIIALECELFGVTNSEDDWTDEAIEEFENLVYSKTLLAEFHSCSAGKYSVRLLDMGLDIAKCLAENSFTQLTEEHPSFGSKAEDIADDLQENIINEECVQVHNDVSAEAMPGIYIMEDSSSSSEDLTEKNNTKDEEKYAAELNEKEDIDKEKEYTEAEGKCAQVLNEIDYIVKEEEVEDKIHVDQQQKEDGDNLQELIEEENELQDNTYGNPIESISDVRSEGNQSNKSEEYELEDKTFGNPIESISDVRSEGNQSNKSEEYELEDNTYGNPIESISDVRSEGNQSNKSEEHELQDNTIICGNPIESINDVHSEGNQEDKDEEHTETTEIPLSPEIRDSFETSSEGSRFISSANSEENFTEKSPNNVIMTGTDFQYNEVPPAISSQADDNSFNFEVTEDSSEEDDSAVDIETEAEHSQNKLSTDTEIVKSFVDSESGDISSTNDNQVDVTDSLQEDANVEQNIIDSNCDSDSVLKTCSNLQEDLLQDSSNKEMDELSSSDSKIAQTNVSEIALLSETCLKENDNFVPESLNRSLDSGTSSFQESSNLTEVLVNETITSDNLNDFKYQQEREQDINIKDDKIEKEESVTDESTSCLRGEKSLPSESVAEEGSQDEVCENKEMFRKETTDINNTVANEDNGESVLVLPCSPKHSVGTSSEKSLNENSEAK